MTEALYLENSYLASCEATVTAVNGEKITLDRTIFYPRGGGQEHDEGTLIQDGQTYHVYKVRKEGNTILHYAKNGEQLKQGTVTAKLDWGRRYGLMRHHSLLHVLGAVMYDAYGALATGNQIYPNRARIDFQGVGQLSDSEREDIVNETNKIIAANYPISTRTISRQEAEQIPGLIKTAVNLLPPHVHTVRLVKIESIDEQACGGTHVKHTQEIGTASIMKVKSKGKNNKRIEVMAE